MLKKVFNLKVLLVLILFCVYLRELFFTTWLGDDCAITFRTVLNFTHGYGARFNLLDRVQTYTHPLWFLILSFFNFFIFKDSTAVLYFSCFLFSTLTFILFLIFNRNKTCLQILFLSLIYFCSRCFTDYSTSGLENPLSHFLVLCIFILATKIYLSPNKKNLSFFIFLSSLLLITRQDFLILVFPLGLCTLYNAHKKISIKSILTSLIIFTFPIYCWLIFSIIYYGFPFPNTAYAKLISNITIKDKLVRGGNYFLETLIHDPITMAIIFLPIFIPVKKINISKSVFIGTICYILYIFWVGGDFMAGRFYSTSFILSLINLSFILENKSIKFSNIFLISIFLLFGFFNIERTLLSHKIETNANINFNNMNDERGMYQHEHNLYGWPHYKLENIKWNYDKNKPFNIILTERLGWASIQDGPNIYFIDKFALSDAFWARVPGDANYTQNGHYARFVSKEYEDSIFKNQNLLTDKKEREFFDLITLVTRAPLFSKERFKAIFILNTKKFDDISPNNKERAFEIGKVKHS